MSGVTSAAPRLGGCDAQALGARFGTPLVVIDEGELRTTMRRFRHAFERPGWTASVTYAAKALLLQAIARIAQEEMLWIDVCSGGELRTVLRAGVPAARCMLHGCNKTDDELMLAVHSDIGFVVIDHAGEIDALANIAERAGRRMRVLVRVNPGIAAHTHHFVQTSAPDSKFGFAIEDGQALVALAAVGAQPSLRLCGIHCHIGSQIYDLGSYAHEIARLAAFAAVAGQRRGVRFDVVNVGGGLGVAEGAAVQAPTAQLWADAVFGAFEKYFTGSGLGRPEIFVEPGRALVALSGTTLYRVGVRKRLPDGTEAIIVDGGMSDNPRPALYEAQYAVSLPARAHAATDGSYTIFGRHCETDRLFRDVDLPAPQPGDVIAVHGTGAYTYSMASNYNRFARPAVVLAANGCARLIARREPLEHVLDLDVAAGAAEAQDAKPA
ncbi:MAG: diaminopimelate decarboxylase [Candidatus Eremiobacteraeota bacterium]|nr:diaminopimelate decarboxylase [Candidatus Eremiobacteraeota bacterium]